MKNSKYFILISIIFLILILVLAYIRLSETKVFIYKSNELDSREVVFNFKKIRYHQVILISIYQIVTILLTVLH